jgi:hypothetical protein
MLPKTIEAEGEIYRVIRVPDPLTRDGERLAALIDHEDQVVWIDPSVASPSRVDETILAVREKLAADLADGGTPHAA